jgi:hypothetical protein
MMLADSILKKIIQLVKHYSRLSCERDLYTISQAAFRMNMSPERFEKEILVPGLVSYTLDNFKMMIPKTEIDNAIASMRRARLNGDPKAYQKFKKKLRQCNNEFS